MERSDLLRQLADILCAESLPHPLRVAIDGVDASGKTVLANALAPIIATRRPVIRASIDGFHHPQEHRYQLGRFSPEGYYRHSFDTDAVIASLLQPLGPEGNRAYRTKIFDYRTNQPVSDQWKTAPENVVLLFDGVFLQQPALRDYWDTVILVDVDFSITIPRAMQRSITEDASWQGRELELREQYARRYVPGQQLYFSEAKPQEHANIIIDNTDFQNPSMTMRNNNPISAPLTPKT